MGMVSVDIFSSLALLTLKSLPKPLRNSHIFMSLRLIRINREKIKKVGLKGVL